MIILILHCLVTSSAQLACLIPSTLSFSGFTDSPTLPGANNKCVRDLSSSGAAPVRFGVSVYPALGHGPVPIFKPMALGAAVVICAFQPYVLEHVWLDTWSTSAMRHRP